jgi:hypothetical protein
MVFFDQFLIAIFIILITFFVNIFGDSLFFVRKSEKNVDFQSKRELQNHDKWE